MRHIPPPTLDEETRSVLVLIVSPQLQTLLVREPARENPQWKLPGGRREPRELLEDAAVREIRAETGVNLTTEQLVLLDPGGWRGRRHFPALYLAGVSQETFDAHVVVGDEKGDPLEVCVVFVDTLLELEDLLTEHRARLRQLLSRS